MTRHEPDSGDAGFTLLELLIGIALFALISALVVGSIRGARQALNVAEQSNDETVIDAAQALVRNLLTEARPLPVDANMPESQIVFSGAASQLSFISTYTAEGQFGGLYSSTFGAAPSNAVQGQFDVVITQALFRSTASPAPMSKTTLLVKNVTALGIRYYGYDDQTTTWVWNNAWSGSARLPTLVEIDVRFPAGDPRLWRPLVAPLVFAD